jgi:hypothetical protein
VFIFAEVISKWTFRNMAIVVVYVSGNYAGSIGGLSLRSIYV